MIYKHGKHEIEMFDSIHNLPILRFQRFNKYQMQSVEIGNTFTDYDHRSVKVIQFLKKGMMKEAIQELENRRQTVFNAFNEFAPSGKAFAILIKRIDGKYYNTFSPDDLDRCLLHLERIGLGNGDAIKKLKEVKKKIETELVVYYPKRFPKNGNPQVTALRKKRIDTVLESIINKATNYEDQIFEIEREMLENDKPNVWNVHQPNNMERALEVDFQKFGIAVSNMTGQKIEEITTMTFFASVEHLEEKHKSSN